MSQFDANLRQMARFYWHLRHLARKLRGNGLPPGLYHAIGEMGGHLGELDDQELEVFKSGLVGVVGCLKRSDLLLQSNHLFV